MKHKLFLVCCVAGSVALFLLLGSSVVYAETIIPESLIVQDTIWTKEGGPYVVEGDITVADGATLRIGAGTEIRGVPGDEFIPGISVVHSRILFEGSAKNPIKINNLGRVEVRNGDARMNFVDINGGEGLSFEGSLVRIASSSIRGSLQAVRSKDSDVTIFDSYIESNTRGIRVEPHQVFQVHNQVSFGFGGIGNILDPVPLASSSVKISNSIVVGNARTAVENFSDYAVEAEGNWWGSEAGPFHVGANRLMGSVEYQPWLLAAPDLVPREETNCCSSVLFIPGLQATRLYDADEKLWEPHNNSDVSRLFLDAHGSTTDHTIYPGLPIDRAYNMKGIYASFLDSLSKLKIDGMVSDWSVFGYDWRKSIPEVVAGENLHRILLNGVEQPISTTTLVETVEDLASRSKTGKISIVAHSNGGLVTKYLIKTLADLGKDNLIEKVVSVAVPYLGTPQAISSLLHGDSQEILKGLLLNAATARQLGSNMATAYSLIPSAEYFKNILSPTIVFASSTVRGLNDGQYPVSISEVLPQKAFILDLLGGRATSTVDDLYTPLKGNGLLMNAADILHSVIDPYVWPESVTRFAIIGWNKVTTKGVEYKNKMVCHNQIFGRSCGVGISHKELTTNLGDGTVVSPSATFNAGSIISLDLKKDAQITGDTHSHADILESSTTQSIIREILSQTISVPGSAGQIVLPSSASWGGPIYTGSTSLVVSTHSPVELHVYDSAGNHTGVIDRELPGVEAGFLTSYEANIPGSDFKITGDNDDPETYIHLPEGNSETYSIVVKGIDVGAATFQLERVGDGGVLESLEMSMPVTPISIATTSVVLDPKQIGAPLASTTVPITIDIDGNGSRDATTTFGSAFDPLLSVSLMKTTVSSLLGNTKHAENITKRLTRIEDLIKKGKLPEVKKVAQKIQKKLKRMHPKKLSQADKDQIIRLVETMIAQFE